MVVTILLFGNFTSSTQRYDSDGNIITLYWATRCVFVVFFHRLSSLEQLQKQKHSKQQCSICWPLNRSLLQEVINGRTKKTPNLCGLFAARDPQRCAGHFPVSYMWILIKGTSLSNSGFQASFTKTLDGNPQRAGLWSQHTWKYVNALLCKWA